MNITLPDTTHNRSSGSIPNFSDAGISFFLLIVVPCAFSVVIPSVLSTDSFVVASVTDVNKSFSDAVDVIIVVGVSDTVDVIIVVGVSDAVDVIIVVEVSDAGDVINDLVSELCCVEVSSVVVDTETEVESSLKQFVDDVS